MNHRPKTPAKWIPPSYHRAPAGVDDFAIGVELTVSLRPSKAHPRMVSRASNCRTPLGVQVLWERPATEPRFEVFRTHRWPTQQMKESGATPPATKGTQPHPRGCQTHFPTKSHKPPRPPIPSHPIKPPRQNLIRLSMIISMVLTFTMVLQY